MSNLAIIPARKNSKRLPGKNKMLLQGVPLIEHTVKSALESGVFKAIYISTDDEDLLYLKDKYGVEIFGLRPGNLATDSASTIDVIKYTLGLYKEVGEDFDTITILQATSPLRNSEDIRNAYELYLTYKQPVISCKEEVLDNKFYYKKDTLNYKLINELTDMIYEINGAIYLTTPSNILSGEIFNNQFTPYIMSKLNSVDIDYEVDFLIAEMIKERENCE